MKKNELLELRGKSAKDLMKMVSVKRKGFASSKKIRRDIAQILTIIKEKELK